MHKGYLKLAAFLGGLSVILGAFAAHGLKQMAPDTAVAIFETGVRYQFYHVFALALAGILWKEYPGALVKAAGILFVAGTVCFSGSLYLLTYFSTTGKPGAAWVGPVTPLGGVLFIAGWICLLLGIGKKASN